MKDDYAELDLMSALSDEDQANRALPSVKISIPRSDLSEIEQAQLERRYPVGTPIQAGDGSEATIMAAYKRLVWEEGDGDLPAWIYAVRGSVTGALGYHVFDEPTPEFWEACQEAAEDAADDGSDGIQ